MAKNSNKPECFPLNESREGTSRLEPEEKKVFAGWLHLLSETGIPYMVAGAFAVHAYTGVWRDTKDLDIFLQPKHVKPALDAFARAGFETEIRAPHWLAKAHHEPYFMDLIFGIGNGQLPVEEDWFKYSNPIEIAGVKVQLLPMEELIASKLYIAARDRFDGADVVHLIRSTEGKVDWQRILSRLGKNSELLLWHLILFDFVYPGHSDYLPQDLMVQLFEKVRRRWSKKKNPKGFCGILLDQYTFAVDVEDWGYEDLRDLRPLVDEEGELM